MGTFTAKSHEVRRGWYVVDATDQTLGRLASAVAFRLRGKHKPEFTPHVDTGDYIVIINAANIRVTGNKLKDKLYRHHTGYVGNMKTIALGKMLQEHPERAITKAVKGMLPKNSLGAAMLKKLRVFPGAEHEHAAQQPEALKL
jgi:large subunit ribosomal protein L13